MAAVGGVPRIGVSACLLGQEVRYDGGHKRDRFLTETFGPQVEWVPVCPEVESGLPTPRESLRLVADRGRLALVMPKSGRDWTAAMTGFSTTRLDGLAAADLAGYVLKKDSPSCGMERVKVYDEAGVAARTGRGVFAAALIQRFPLLPVEEEGRLTDPRLRDNFVERVFAYQRLRTLFAAGVTAGRLVAFHTAHKLQLLAHSPAAYEALGRLVAGVRSLTRGEVASLYPAGFMAALAARATRGRNANVLHHMLGYFSDDLEKASRAEVLALIDDYRLGLVPLVVPVTLVRHHVRRLDVEYLKGQTYLEPHPRELMLRNHV